MGISGHLVALWVGCALTPVIFADVGPVGPRIEVTLQLDKSRFEVGEPIPATVEIINHAETDYLAQSSTEPTGVMDGISFVVTDGNGKAVLRPPVFPKADNLIGSWLVVRRHEKCERKIFLNHWFTPLPPGRYTAQAWYVPRSLAGGSAADYPPVHSEVLEFEIEATTSTKLEVRIARLAEQAGRGDQIAIDFLGFTGENAASAPLIEALYADDAHVQRRAAVALCYLEDQTATLNAVLTKVRDSGPNATAAEWLTFANAPAGTVLPVYLRSLNSTEAGTRLGGITGLCLMMWAALADKKFATAARWAVRHALADRDSRVRYEAVQTVQSHSEPQTVAILTEIANNDPVTRVRSAAAAVLKEIRAGKSSPPVLAEKPQ